MVIACLIAALAALRAHEKRWHGTAWLAVGALFAGLVYARVTALEETMRADLRAVLRAGGSYDDRRDLQNIVIALLLVMGAAIGSWLAYRAVRAARRRRDRAVVIAMGAGASLAALMILQLISLHWIDAVLYGPLKLNWFIDVGLALSVVAAALYYVRKVRAGALRPTAKRARSRR